MSTREFAPWVQPNGAFSYLADVFWHDRKAQLVVLSLPLRNCAPPPCSTRARLDK